MRQLIPVTFVMLLLLSACSSARYGHRTRRVHATHHATMPIKVRNATSQKIVRDTIMESTLVYQEIVRDSSDECLHPPVQNLHKTMPETSRKVRVVYPHSGPFQYLRKHSKIPSSNVAKKPTRANDVIGAMWVCIIILGIAIALMFAIGQTGAAWALIYFFGLLAIIGLIAYAIAG